MANDTFIGIRYPIQESDLGNYVDLTRTGRQAVKSNLTFLLSTQKGEVLFKPDFGTNIAQFLFEQLDDQTIQDIKNEITSAVELNIKGVAIDNITVDQNDETNRVNIQIEFSFNEGIFVAKDIILLSF
jgi:phage baseplate assembly protein W